MKNRFRLIPAILMSLALTTPALAASVVLKLGHIAEPTNPYAMGADHFAELVKEKSKGDIVLEVAQHFL